MERAKALNENRSDIQVFICYAREDIELAKRLYEDLERAGVSPWLDTKDLKAGEKWKIIIPKMMEKSSYVLMLLSQTSVTKRGFVQHEINEALEISKSFPPSAVFILPVRLEECEPPLGLEDLQWVDLFPDYSAGVQKLLQVLAPEGHDELLRRKIQMLAAELVQLHPLRSEPREVSGDEFKEVFTLDDERRPREYIQNNYEYQREVVMDHATGLMWQKSGSGEYLEYADAQKYVEELNQKKFAGYDNWRLPTIPELISLLEPEKQSNGLYINPMFDRRQWWCWSADRRSDSGSSSSAWRVYFHRGRVYCYPLDREGYVRAVRSGRAP